MSEKLKTIEINRVISQSNRIKEVNSSLIKFLKIGFQFTWQGRNRNT